MSNDTRPDGTYADWQGTAYQVGFVSRPKDTVRLRTETWTEIPPGFEEKSPGVISALIPESQLTALYRLQTYCRLEGERCRVTHRHPDGQLQLQLETVSQPLAERLGFQSRERGVFIRTVPASDVTDLRQIREEIPV